MAKHSSLFRHLWATCAVIGGSVSAYIQTSTDRCSCLDAPFMSWVVSQTHREAKAVVTSRPNTQGSFLCASRHLRHNDSEIASRGPHRHPVLIRRLKYSPRADRSLHRRTRPQFAFGGSWAWHPGQTRDTGARSPRPSSPRCAS